MTGGASCLNNTTIMDSTSVVINNIIKMIPEFNGEPAERAETDLQIFLNICQAYYKTLSSQDQQTFLSLVPKLKLRGIPYEICNNKSFTTLEEFHKALSDYYFPTKNLSGLTHDLQSCIQLNGETAHQFGHRIQVKLKECEIFLENLCKENSEIMVAEYQSIAVQTFRKGLISQSLKQYACMLDEKTLSGVVKKVSDLEKLENECRTPSIYIQQSSVGLENAIPQVFSTQNILPQAFTSPLQKDSQYFYMQNSIPTFNHHQSRNELGTQQYGIQNQNNNDIWNRMYQDERKGEARRNWNSGNTRRLVICFRCGQPNHISRECRNPQVYCQNCQSGNHDTRICPRGNRAELRRSQTQEICEFCQRYGHNMQECAAKRQWDARQHNSENQGNEGLPVVSSNGRQ